MSVNERRRNFELQQSVPIWITSDIVNCFEECVESGNYDQLEIRCREFIQRIDVRLKSVNLGLNYPFTYFTQSFKKFIEMLIVRRETDFTKIYCDHTRALLECIADAIHNNNWRAFYTKYRYEIDFVIGNARDQKQFDFNIEFNGEYYKSFKSRDAAPLPVRADPPVRAHPFLSRNSGEMLQSGGIPKTTPYTLPSVWPIQTPSPKNENGIFLQTEADQCPSCVPNKCCVAFSCCSTPVNPSANQMHNNNLSKKMTLSDSSRRSYESNEAENIPTQSVSQSRTTTGNVYEKKYQNQAGSSNHSSSSPRQYLSGQNTRAVEQHPASPTVISIRGSNNYSNSHQEPKKVDNQSSTIELSTVPLPKSDVVEPTENSHQALPDFSMGSKSSKESLPKPVIQSSEQLLEASGVLKDSQSVEEMTGTNAEQYEEELQKYEMDMRNTKRKAEEQLGKVDNLHNEINRNFGNEKRRTECFSETITSPVSEEYDSSFEKKLKEQREKFEEEQKMKKEERRRRQEEHKEYIKKVREESIERFRFIMTCIVQKRIFEQQEQEWSKWIEGCRRNVNKLKSEFYYFEGNVYMPQYKKTAELDEDETLSFSEDVKLLSKKIFFAFDVLHDDFDTLKQVEGQYPDALFVRVLQKCIADLADELISLINLTDQLGANKSLFKSMQTTFDSLSANKIFTTEKLKSVCKTAKSEDYEHIVYPSMTVIVEEVDE